MNPSQNTFATLAVQAGCGDANARQQLERDLVHVVRRVLQQGHANSPMDRRIMAEADRYPEAREDRDLLARRVASGICLSVIAAQMRTAQSAAETIATFSNAGLCQSA